MNNSKINQSFLGEYLELDKACAEKFGAKSGVTEYINKLTNIRFAPRRDNVLPRLSKYRSVRNRIAHEPGALQSIDTLSRDDVSWLKSFLGEVKRGKDPISLYLKKASRRANSRAFLRTLVLLGIAAAVIAVLVIAIFVF